jgi:hypothetical protein
MPYVNTGEGFDNDNVVAAVIVAAIAVVVVDVVAIVVIVVVVFVGDGVVAFANVASDAERAFFKDRRCIFIGVCDVIFN